MRSTDDIRVCVLRIEGTNCEAESYRAFKHIGSAPEMVHINELIRGRKKLQDYHILMIPGGFSAGDYIRAGAIFAARLKSALGAELLRFVEDLKPVLGVCNGFQVLIELGLLPGLRTTMAERAEAALATNDSGRFECRPTLVKNENRGKCIFVKYIKKGQILTIPSAHAEGKFVLPKKQEKKLLASLINNDQIVFRYVDTNGNYAGYPWNPNGSVYNIAGICNRYGNVMGMMPHPERVFYRITHPDWTRQPETINKYGDGMPIFKACVDYAAEKF